MSKPHSITVTITTTTDGEVNQRTLNEEFATTVEEFIHKDFVISEEVVAGVLKAKHRLAAEYLESLKKGK